MEEPKTFPCTQCGCCCQHIHIVLPIDFPYKVDSKGVCEKFNKSTKKCIIYDSRPLICNITELAKTLGKNIDDFYHQNILECNKLMDRYNIPENFRILINK
jgi:uncharacterized protein